MTSSNGNRPRKPRTASEERAYGPVHRRRRRVLLAQLAEIGSAPCPLCGLPMNVSMRLQLDHSDPAGKQLGMPGDRLVHATCNEGRGGELGQAVMRTQANGHPARKPERQPMTEEQIDAAMERLGQHRAGCRCRERIPTLNPSQCW